MGQERVTRGPRGGFVAGDALPLERVSRRLCGGRCRAACSTLICSKGPAVPAGSTSSSSSAAEGFLQARSWSTRYAAPIVRRQETLNAHLDRRGRSRHRRRISQKTFHGAWLRRGDRRPMAKMPGFQRQHGKLRRHHPRSEPAEARRPVGPSAPEGAEGIKRRRSSS